MAGAYVGLADDPQAGINNPAGLPSLKKMGSDFFYDRNSPHSPDHLCLAFVNPASASGSPIAMGVWSQGIFRNENRTFYVPYAAMSQKITRSAALGLVTRFPYVNSRVDSERSRWEAVADVSARASVSTMHIGVSIERCFGGVSFIERRLHFGAAFVSQEGIAVSYEWRAHETDKRFDFHYQSSHWGTELPVGKYFALRAGYASGEFTRITGGFAVGLMKAGWRVEIGSDLPASGTGQTRWAVGLNYRV